MNFLVIKLKWHVYWLFEKKTFNKCLICLITMHVTFSGLLPKINAFIDNRRTTQMRFLVGSTETAVHLPVADSPSWDADISAVAVAAAAMEFVQLAHVFIFNCRTCVSAAESRFIISSRIILQLSIIYSLFYFVTHCMQATKSNKCTFSEHEARELHSITLHYARWFLAMFRSLLHRGRLVSKGLITMPDSTRMLSCINTLAWRALRRQ